MCGVGAVQHLGELAPTAPERSRTVPTSFLPAVVVRNNIAANGKPVPYRKKKNVNETFKLKHLLNQPANEDVFVSCVYHQRRVRDRVRHAQCT